MAGWGALFGLLGLFWLFWIIIIGLFIGLFVFWIMMIVDVAQRKFPEQNQQLTWILIVVLASYLGAIIYYFVVKRKDKQVKTVEQKSKVKTSRKKKRRFR